MSFTTDKSSLTIIKRGMIVLDILFIIGLSIYFFKYENKIHPEANNLNLCILTTIMIFSNISIFKRIQSIEKKQ